MNLINKLNKTNHEKVIFYQKDGLKAVLAYHTLGNGTTFGGVRLLPYNANEKAITDALRLSEAMSYKLAMINESYGGSKAVVLMPKEGKSREFLHKVGDFIEEENGKFITAIDFGFHPNDAKIIREKTKYIFALKDSEFGQSGLTTAYGVLEGIKSSLKEVYGTRKIMGRSFAIQGLGSVGNILAKELIKKKGKVYVSDTNNERLNEFNGLAKVVNPKELISLDVDVFSPCGPGYVINKNTIPKLNCKIIGGGANCQLEDEVSDDKLLFERGILIAPDYVINAGGVIAGVAEYTGKSLKEAIKRLPIISKNLNEIYKLSKEKNKGTYAVAKEIALRRINMRGLLKRLAEREEKVLRKRFGIGVNSEHTLEEVGQDFDVTRERIRKIESKALRKLRHPSRTKKLRSFVEKEEKD